MGGRRSIGASPSVRDTGMHFFFNEITTINYLRIKARLSPQARAFFSRCCGEVNVPDLELLRWIRTRWSSMYCLLERLLKLREVRLVTSRIPLTFVTILFRQLIGSLCWPIRTNVCQSSRESPMQTSSCRVVIGIASRSLKRFFRYMLIHGGVLVLAYTLLGTSRCSAILL